MPSKYKAKTQLEIDPIKENGALKHGLYRRIDLHRVNGRTKLGRSIRAISQELRDYVGTGGNVLTELLLGRIVYKIIRLSNYERRNIGKEANEEAPHYIPLSNSLRLDLQALANLIGETKGLSLQDYITLKDKEKSSEEGKEE